MARLVFLLEEPSMHEFLRVWLPRAFPDLREYEHFLCVPHEGKSDLDKSIPRKLAAWQVPGDRFVILRDNDNANCIDLKARLKQSAIDLGKPDTLIRLVCQELESWYLGDLAAVAAAFDTPRIDTAKHRKRFAEPDEWQKPSAEIARLAPAFQKRSGARRIAAHMTSETNRSHSFHVFHRGLTQLTQTLNRSD